MTTRTRRKNRKKHTWKVGVRKGIVVKLEENDNKDKTKEQEEAYNPLKRAYCQHVVAMWIK